MGLLFIAQEAPETYFIACVSSLRPLVGGGLNGAGGLPDSRSPVNVRRRMRPMEGGGFGEEGGYEALSDSLRHEPQVPPRIAALMSTESRLGKSRSGFMHGFDAIHVWKQLHDLQILVSFGKSR